MLSSSDRRLLVVLGAIFLLGGAAIAFLTPNGFVLAPGGPNVEAPRTIQLVPIPPRHREDIEHRAKKSAPTRRHFASAPRHIVAQPLGRVPSVDQSPRPPVATPDPTESGNASPQASQPPAVPSVVPQASPEAPAATTPDPEAPAPTAPDPVAPAPSPANPPTIGDIVEGITGAAGQAVQQAGQVVGGTVDQVAGGLPR